MGFVKYFEDNQRIIGERKYLHSTFELHERPNVYPPVFDCPYCTLSFGDKPKLFDHIGKHHSTVSRMLILNQQVVQNVAHVGKIESLDIVRYDLTEPVKINGEVFSCAERKSDITALAQKNLKSNKLEIQIGERVWKIVVLRSEEINLPKLETTIIEWSRETQNHHPIQKYDKSDFNKFESRCLDGFFNYFIACNAEPVFKTARYEDALHLLSEFEQLVPSANVILKLIAFKFNWGDKLRSLCCKADPFANIYEFFVGVNSDEVYSFSGDKEIYIEDDLGKSIQAILDYQSQNNNRVNEYLRGFDLDALQNMQDENARDRIYLLKARLAANRGRSHEARRFYDEIKTPFFEAEREKFIKDMRTE